MVVSIGVFDGVHIGHRRVLEKLREVASSKKMPALVFTISHPPEYLSPDFPGLLLSVEERVAILSRFSEVVVLDFFRSKTCRRKNLSKSICQVSSEWSLEGTSGSERTPKGILLF